MITLKVLLYVNTAARSSSIQTSIYSQSIITNQSTYNSVLKARISWLNRKEPGVTHAETKTSWQRDN